ncbi:type II secretion system protein GspL [Pseudohongiella nitratireducens]|uniref:type II secretion system protein GspL n=1 Tax=Pseudohongiella nitratireducens TaxID=1768907 RepID=UPI0030EF195F
MKVSSAIIKPLHRDESGASYLWQCLDNNNRAVGDVKTGTARQIGQYLNGKAGILLFDASDVVDSRVKVSQKQQKQLSQLLAFEIEPQLASDITQLHIAGHVVAGEDVAVAHLDRSLMVAAVNDLEAAGVAIKHCYSEGHLLNARPDHWLLVHNPVTDALTCCWGENRYCAVKSSQATMLIDTLLSGCEQPGNISVLTTSTEDAVPIKAMLDQKTTARIQLETGEHVSWQWMSLEEPVRAVDLRQGEFQAPVRWGQKIGWLRMPALAAALALTTYIVATALSTYQANRQFEALQLAIEDSYRQAMPQGVLVDAAQQLRSQLAQLTGSPEGAGLLSILDQVAPALADIQGIRVQRLNYSAGRQELSLSISALSNEDILSFNDALNAAGLNARTQNITRQGESHLAQFVIFATGVS